MARRGTNAMPCQEEAMVGKLLRRGTQKGIEGTRRLAKVLPTTSVLIFKLLLPIVAGPQSQSQQHDYCCNTARRGMTYVLLGVCSTVCLALSFTDSFRSSSSSNGADGCLYYGIVTPKGLALLMLGRKRQSHRLSNEEKQDLMAYRLKSRDVMHAVLSVMVLLTVAATNVRAMNCIMGSSSAAVWLRSGVAHALPVAVSFVCSIVFLVFPYRRHGIGYPCPPHLHHHSKNQCAIPD